MGRDLAKRHVPFMIGGLIVAVCVWVGFHFGRTVVPPTFWVEYNGVQLSQIMPGTCPIITMDRNVKRDSEVRWILQPEQLHDNGWSRDGLREESGNLFLKKPQVCSQSEAGADTDDGVIVQGDCVASPPPVNVALDWNDCQTLDGYFRVNLLVRPVRPYAQPGFQTHISPPVRLWPGP